MDIIETSEEDKGIFKRLLTEYVEATDKMTIETLELWHTRIRQCILHHKKDQFRLPLFEVGILNYCNIAFLNAYNSAFPQFPVVLRVRAKLE